MKEYLRQKTGWKVIGLALAFGLGLACILISVVCVIPSRADVGVHPILPDGSSLKPDEPTLVEMQAEKVTITVLKATEADNGG